MSVTPNDYTIWKKFRDIINYNVYATITGVATGTAIGYLDRYSGVDLSPVAKGIGTAQGLAGISGTYTRNMPLTALGKTVKMVTLDGLPFQFGKNLSRKSRNLSHTASRPSAFVKEKSFDKDAHRAARTSMEAYKPVGERTSHGNWEYLQHYSSKRIAVYENHHDKHWHIAMRGSDDLWSMGQNSSIAMGTYKNNPDFYGSIKKRVKALQNIHSVHHPRDGKFTTSGHSLAGTANNVIASDPEIAGGIDRSDAFNPGGVGSMGKHDKSHHIHINNSDFATYMADTNTGATVHYHEEVTDTYNPIKHLADSHWHEGWERKPYWRNEWDYPENTYRSDALEASEEPIVETSGIE